MGQNLSPNQFALPGMEEQAHPLAKYVARGFRFSEKTDVTEEEGLEHQHRLYAYHPDADRPEALTEYSKSRVIPHKQVAELNWAGPHSRYYFPGEISWVNRTSRVEGSSGITDAMHAWASQGSKSTVPVHSVDRSDEGNRWARRVGPPHLTPTSVREIFNEPYTNEEHTAAVEKAMNWTPPTGTHPYERAGAPPQFKPMKGQRKFRGMKHA